MFSDELLCAMGHNMKYGHYFVVLVLFVIIVDYHYHDKCRIDCNNDHKLLFVFKSMM